MDVCVYISFVLTLFTCRYTAWAVGNVCVYETENVERFGLLFSCQNLADVLLPYEQRCHQGLKLTYASPTGSWGIEKIY